MSDQPHSGPGVGIIFASGMLGTVTVSDKIVSPWNWELTAGENPAFPHTGESCHVIGVMFLVMPSPSMNVAL